MKETYFKPNDINLDLATRKQLHLQEQPTFGHHDEIPLSSIYPIHKIKIQ